MSGEGDLDPTEGHSELSVGTLPLTDKDPPKNPENKSPPQEPSGEEPTSGSLEKDKKHPPKEHPETHIDPEGHPAKPLKRSQKDPVVDPFSRFWSGETAEVTDKNKKKHRWLTRKPKRRHSDGLGILDGQIERPYRYVLEGERELLPRPRFYSRCLDASSVSLEYVDFILRHLVQQRNQELEQEKLEKEREESERRRQSELPIDIRDKPKRLIPVDPMISPFDSGEDKVPGEGAYRPTDHPFSTVTDLESPSSPLGPGYPIPHKELTDSEDSIDSETESIMTATTKELIDTLTKTLMNINQSPTIPLPVFKGKKGEDPEDHILKVEDYFGEAAYSAWGALTFDPNKDDIEQFIQKVEELAKKLGYNQDAQVMAVKSVLPRDVYGICMTYKTLTELKAFLIELFSNPKMREAVPGTASAVAEPGVFSMGQHMENNVVGPTAADVSKIRQDMNDLQVRFNKITSADFRSKSSKPWKPEVTPPRRRGGFDRGRSGRQFDSAQRNDRFKNSESNSNQDRDNDQRNNTGNFRSRGQNRGNFRGNMRGKGRGRGRFDKSPNVRRPRVASKTVDKDKMRCHYCNEYGHFIRECSKKNRDENKTGHFNGMSTDYYENDLYTGEDYDDDVFASLNS